MQPNYLDGIRRRDPPALKHFEVAGKIGSTADNLKDAVAGETYEYKEMYLTL